MKRIITSALAGISTVAVLALTPLGAAESPGTPADPQPEKKAHGHGEFQKPHGMKRMAHDWRMKHGGPMGGTKEGRFGHGKMLGRMLNLTDEQKQKVKEVMEANRPKIEAIRKEQQEKMKAVMDDAKDQIRPILTDDQKQVLDDLEKLREDMAKLKADKAPPAKPATE